MTALSPREAYRRWAPSYGAETAITHLDAELVDALTPPLGGRRIADIGCGTGRRLRGLEAIEAIGVEPSAEMLAEGAREGRWPAQVRFVRGDVRALPLGESFDVVWCRLVLGHIAELARAYAELARVTAAGGRLVVSDFHPSAWHAGHRRTFRDDDGVHEVEHHVHSLRAHDAAAAAAGLVLAEVREGLIGEAVRDFYAEAGKLALYRSEIGLPIVVALAFDKAGDKAG
jgi:malonyl-CoA O-methyltransferase